MRLKNKHIALIIIVILVGGIYLAKGFDMWSTESEKIPEKLTEGVGVGSYDPFDIRGSYTFGEISELFDMDIALLAEAFQLGDASSAEARQTKDLESLYGELPDGIEIGNESVQVFVAIMKELDLQGSDAYLPLSAVNVLLNENPEIAEDMLTYLESHQIDVTIATVDSEGAVAIVTESSPEKDSEETRVNGNTTFSEVLGFGITKEQIETILDADMPPENQTVKSYCSDNSLSFSEVKEALNALITP